MIQVMKRLPHTSKDFDKSWQTHHLYLSTTYLWSQIHIKSSTLCHNTFCFTLLEIFHMETLLENMSDKMCLFYCIWVFTHPTSLFLFMNAISVGCCLLDGVLWFNFFLRERPGTLQDSESKWTKFFIITFKLVSCRVCGVGKCSQLFTCGELSRNIAP